MTRWGVLLLLSVFAVAVVVLTVMLPRGDGQASTKPGPPHAHVDDPHPDDDWRWVTIDGVKCLVYEPLYQRTATMQCDLPASSTVAGG